MAPFVVFLRFSCSPGGSLGFLFHMSAQCCFSVVFCGISEHVLARMCVLRLFTFARGMGRYGQWAPPIVVCYASGRCVSTEDFGLFAS